MSFVPALISRSKAYRVPHVDHDYHEDRVNRRIGPIHSNADSKLFKQSGYLAGPRRHKPLPNTGADKQRQNIRGKENPRKIP
mgnify:CR=1 FL=1